MSAFLSVSKFLSARRNIKIVIYDYSQPLGTVQFFIHFQNMASSNVSIQSISIIENEREYPCELIPKKIRGSDSELLKSTDFPIFLCPDQGYLCFLEFVSCRDIQLVPGKRLIYELLQSWTDKQIRNSWQYFTLFAYPALISAIPGSIKNREFLFFSFIFIFLPLT